ncbi:MAG: glycosyltransferase family 2 protein [Candidatus Kapabacteria bacterium]|nr:glycosyltransferase family 2 protein [Candidatus Kapabacteria bacterium]
MSSEDPELSLIIPCFNEAERISSSLDKALAYFANVTYSYEILIVDDGSRDDTVRVVSHYTPNGIRVIEQGINKGKGSVVRLGMISAKGKYRVFTDADFSTPIEELPKLLTELDKGADICIGSRRLDRSLVKQHQPWYRELIGVMGNKIISLLLISGIEDTQCGFKGMTARAAEALFPVMKIDGFGFDVELLYLAKRIGLRITQVPVLWYNDDRSRLNPIRDSIKTFSEILRIKKLHS